MPTDLERLLTSAQAPRSPRPQFDRHLRAELLGDAAARDTAEDGAPGARVEWRRRDRRPKGLAVAVAAAVALIGGLVWGLGRGGDRTEVADETGRVTADEPRGRDLGVATSACQAFAGGTYGGFTLSELTGPANGSVITTAGGAELGTAQLEVGFGALVAGLETSGFRSDELDATVSRIDSNLRRAERRAAEEKLVASQKVLRRVGEDLVGLDAILRDLGVPSCS